LGLADVTNDKTNRQSAVDEANQWLKAEGYPVRLKLKGNNLALRATLPNKPGKGEGRSREEISLLIPATKTGLARAKREAVILADRMANGSFNWAMYIEEADPLADKSIGQWVDDFKAHYMKSSKIRPDVWVNTWASTFKKLPQDEPLKKALLLAVVLSTVEDSRNRELTCQRLQRLADYAELPIDLKPYLGDYEPEPRDIPPDELIVKHRGLIPNPGWQWVYGIMAAFGVRPHECFDCQFIDPLTLKIGKDTKTGARKTRAIHPEWSEDWDLMNGTPPATGAVQGRARGQLVSSSFRRYELPFGPYDLRHAWAIRASVTGGLSVTSAAKMMGHKVATHTEVYHQWLTDATVEKEYSEKIRRRPTPPTA
jgi:integrase